LLDSLLQEKWETLREGLICPLPPTARLVRVLLQVLHLLHSTHAKS